MSLYQDAIIHYGHAHQILQAAQEHAELAAQLTKYGQSLIRNEKPMNGFEVASERADCEIMDKQLDIMLHHLNGAKVQQKQYKLSRLSARITRKADEVIDEETMLSEDEES